MQKTKNKKAFTLIELLIVMVILAILSGLGLMAFGTVQMKSRDSRRKQDLANISKALDVYYNDYGAYPASTAGFIYGCAAGGAQACGWGDPWQDDKNTLYMSALPQDPDTSHNYFYHQVDNDSYYLFARLENEDDGDIAMDGTDPSYYMGYVCDGAALGCNYVIMSTNLNSKPAVAPI
jgi:general secretion pathway protein G